MKTNEDFMRETYRLAKASAVEGFDPFGAILVRNGKFMASSQDKCILYSDPTAHAELILISEYCRNHQLISLDGYTLFCNVEPCVMCSGAIHWSRLDSVVFGVAQASLQKVSGGNRKPSCAEMINTGGGKTNVIGPLLETEGMDLLRAFPFTSKKAKHAEYWGKS